MEKAADAIQCCYGFFEFLAQRLWQLYDDVHSTRGRYIVPSTQYPETRGGEISLSSHFTLLPSKSLQNPVLWPVLTYAPSVTMEDDFVKTKCVALVSIVLIQTSSTASKSPGLPCFAGSWAPRKQSATSPFFKTTFADTYILSLWVLSTDPSLLRETARASSHSLSSIFSLLLSTIYSRRSL